MEVLRIDVEDVDDHTVIAVQGELDAATAPQLRQRFVEVLTGRRHGVVVDLDGVDFIDSVGLGVLIGGLKRARGRDLTFAVVCTNRRTLQLFELTGLDAVLPTYVPREAALRA